MKKAASFLLAVLIAAGTVPMAGNTSAEIDMNDLPTPISSDAKAVKSFKDSKPRLAVTCEKPDSGYMNWEGAFAEVGLEWEPVKNALYYNVYKKVGDYDYKLVEATFDTNYSENICKFTSYRVTAVTFTYDDEMVETDFSNTVHASASTLSSDETAVKTFKKSKPRLKGGLLEGSNRVELYWKPVKNALYYNIYVKKNGEKEYSLDASLFGTEYEDYVGKSAEYCITAVAVTDEGEKVETAFSNTVKVRRPRPSNHGGIDIDAGEGVASEGSEILEETDDYYDSERYAENTEEYSDAKESGYKNAATDPVSTFSADVDTASYANLRRLIKGGDTIPEDAVRIEEMLNYFDFNYVQPTGESPFSLTYELSDCPGTRAASL